MCSFGVFASHSVVAPFLCYVGGYVAAISSILSAPLLFVLSFRDMLPPSTPSPRTKSGSRLLRISIFVFKSFVRLEVCDDTLSICSACSFTNAATYTLSLHFFFHFSCSSFSLSLSLDRVYLSFRAFFSSFSLYFM